jgi:HTH-type transcriptional regulator, bacterioopsin transcriptional activator and related proteins
VWPVTSVRQQGGRVTNRVIDDGRTVATLETIDVLLVDDNERWITFIAEELERQEPSIRVTSALSANEALATLEETAVDCLVVDYRLPETNGIRLTERIRETRPMVPIILVTGEGSEAIATRAIDAGVTDYLPKNPKVDQTPVLVSKIRNAVERRTLWRAIEDGERRYRTAVEQSRDAIVILRNGRIQFCNKRFAELTGVQPDECTDADRDFADAFVHEADRERFRELRDTHLDDGVHDVRLVADDGTVRHCEYTGRNFSDDGGPATMLSIRDVTERRLKAVRHQRERRLNRRVQRALVTSQTREDLETAIVTELSEQGCPLVWIGAVVEDRVQPRVVAGERRYVDEVDLTIDGREHECEPSVWAARTGAPQVIPDLDALFPASWRDLALDCGFRSGIALPIRYEDVTYGVLAVYRDAAETVDNDERTLLTDLAATVGYAIHHLDARKALTADHGVEARIELRDGGHYLSEVAADSGLDATQFELLVHSTYPSASGDVVQYATLRGGSAERFREAAANHSVVREVVPSRTAGRDSFQLTVEGPTPESSLAPFNALVRSTHITPDRAELRIDLPSREKLGAVIDRLEERYGRVSVLSCVEGEWGGQANRFAVDTNALTEKQATALEAAYRHGYFEQPRRRSATEIAGLLGVSHSTYLQHLRAAQQKVFSRFYE